MWLSSDDDDADVKAAPALTCAPLSKRQKTCGEMRSGHISDGESSLDAPPSEMKGASPRFKKEPGLWAEEMRMLLARKFGKFTQQKKVTLITGCSGTGAPTLAMDVGYSVPAGPTSGACSRAELLCLENQHLLCVSGCACACVCVCEMAQLACLCVSGGGQVGPVAERVLSSSKSLPESVSWSEAFLKKRRWDHEIPMLF